MPEDEENEFYEEFIGKDSLESYLYFKHKSSTNPIEMYRILQQRITFGKDLLISLLFENNKEQIEKLIKEANDVLKQKPSSRKVIIDDHHITMKNGEVKLVHKINARGMNEIQSIDDKYVENLEFFSKQQYEQCLDELLEVFSEIDRYLAENGMFKVSNPTIEALIQQDIIEELTKADLEEVNK